jgi:hypothetical protein
MLKRQGHMTELERAEEMVANVESNLRNKVLDGEMTADQADQIKSYKIWFLAQQESKSAPTMMAIWDALEQLPKTPSDYDRIILERKEALEREFAEKLREYINPDEV